MKRFGLLLVLLASVSSAQNQNFPTQSWVRLLSPVVAPATGTQVSGPLQLWQSSIGVFACVGTWAGATVTLEFQGPDGSTMIIAGTATTLTANGAGVFYLPVTNIQAVLSSAASTTALTCSAGIVASPNQS